MSEEVKEEEQTTDPPGPAPANKEKTLKVMGLGEDLGDFTEGDVY